MPDTARLRAALARLLSEKYRFRASDVPRLRAALALDSAPVCDAFQRQYVAPLESTYAPRLGPTQALAWLGAGIGRRLDALPAFWFAFVITFVMSVP